MLVVVGVAILKSELFQNALGVGYLKRAHFPNLVGVAHLKRYNFIVSLGVGFLNFFFKLFIHNLKCWWGWNSWKGPSWGWDKLFPYVVWGWDSWKSALTAHFRNPTPNSWSKRKDGKVRFGKAIKKISASPNFFLGGWIVFFSNWWGWESQIFKTYRRNCLAVKYSFSKLLGVRKPNFQNL